MNVRHHKKMTNRIHKSKSGFTLIEIMVAVSIFVIVAFIVTSTLLTILDAGRRANKIRLIIDNMNFALDSMTVKMKFGTGYEISNTPETKGTISFTDRDGANICYKKYAEGTGNGVIQKCVGGTNSDFCSGGVNCTNITTDEINVTGLKFEEGTCSDVCINRQIIILVQAKAEIKNQPVTTLEFQTSVSQSLSN